MIKNNNVYIGEFTEFPNPENQIRPGSFFLDMTNSKVYLLGVDVLGEKTWVDMAEGEEFDWDYHFAE